MTDPTHFDILLLIARPAAGKSEIIDYLKNIPDEERLRRFHIGTFDEIDDFPMLWTWFEEDALLDKMGKPRLYTDAEGYFLYPYLWDLLIERIGLEYQKKQRDPISNSKPGTTLIEFSRGSEHGGYRSAFAHLSRQILEKAVLLYVDVTWEESLRKNRKRFNPDKPDSILEHSLPDAKLERLYKETDWFELTKDDPQYARQVLPAPGRHESRRPQDAVDHPADKSLRGSTDYTAQRPPDDTSRQGYLSLQGLRVPYVVFDNSDDVTTQKGPALGSRLEETLSALWNLYANR